MFLSDGDAPVFPASSGSIAYYIEFRICPTGTGCDMSTHANIIDLWENDVPSGRNPTRTQYSEALFQTFLLDAIAAHNASTGPLWLH